MKGRSPQLWKGWASLAIVFVVLFASAYLAVRFSHGGLQLARGSHSTEFFVDEWRLKTVTGRLGIRPHLPGAPFFLGFSLVAFVWATGILWKFFRR